jgi:predicted DNA-binding protein
MSRETKYPHQVQTRLTDEQEEGTQRLADIRGVDRSTVIRTAIENEIVNAYAKGEIK